MTNAAVRATQDAVQLLPVREAWMRGLHGCTIALCSMLQPDKAYYRD